MARCRPAQSVALAGCSRDLVLNGPRRDAEFRCAFLGGDTESEQFRTAELCRERRVGELRWRAARASEMVIEPPWMARVGFAQRGTPVEVAQSPLMPV